MIDADESAWRGRISGPPPFEGFTEHVVLGEADHWFFPIQPIDLPERLIEADPCCYLEHTLQSRSKIAGAFDKATLSAYVKAFSASQRKHAINHALELDVTGV
jgi:hypothetical protein